MDQRIDYTLDQFHSSIQSIKHILQQDLQIPIHHRDGKLVHLRLQPDIRTIDAMGLIECLDYNLHLHASTPEPQGMPIPLVRNYMHIAPHPHHNQYYSIYLSHIILAVDSLWYDSKSQSYYTIYIDKSRLTTQGTHAIQYAIDHDITFSADISLPIHLLSTIYPYTDYAIFCQVQWA